MAHAISSMLSRKDELLCVQTDETVSDALTQMIAKDYSQLPVVDGEGNLEGIISEQTVARTCYHLNDKVSLLELTVEHCMEPAITLSQDDELVKALNRLRETYAIVIVDDRRPVDIITNHDAVQFFRDVAEGLLMIENIEVNLRQYIDNALEDEGKRADAMKNAFAYIEEKTGRPKDFNRLSLDDYIQLVVNGDNWPLFEGYFQPKDLFLQHMNSVRDIRNQLAHFRDKLGDVQYDYLQRVEDWIEARPKPALRAAEPGNFAHVDAIKESGDIGEPSEIKGKYAPLYQWLARQANFDKQGDDVWHSFETIEELLGDELPPSAKEYRAWWSNDPTSGRQSHSWMRAGWKVESVDFSAGAVVFRRTDTVLYHLFYADLLERLKQKRPGITRATKTYPDNEWYFSGGRTGVHFGWVFISEGELRTQVYIDTGDQTQSKKLFDALYNEREAIEREFGGTLRWERLDDQQASRISTSIPAVITMPQDELEEAKTWALETIFKLVDALQKRVKRL